MIVRNCRFHDNRARGMIIQAGNVTIENCRFSHTEGPALKFTTGWTERLWCEGVGVSNCVVRGCVFENCNYGSPPEIHDIEVNSYMHQPGYAQGTVASEYPVIRDILIENNSFVGSRGAISPLKSATGIVLRNNRIQERKTGR